MEFERRPLVLAPFAKEVIFHLSDHLVHYPDVHRLHRQEEIVEEDEIAEDVREA